jgi:CBS domain containing-hemolysin-like protein
LLHIALFGLCLLLLAVASAAQAAFGYLNATRLRHLMQQGASRAEAVSRVVRDPGGLLSGVALLYLIAVAGATVVTVDHLQRISQGGATAQLVVGLIAACLLVLIAQVFGRALGATRPERASQLLYPLFRVFGALTLFLLAPWQALSDRLIQRIFGARPEDRVATSEEDLRILIDAVEETEALEEDEREMIASIFEMSDRSISQIMVPRIDVVAIEGDVPVADAVDVLVSTGHSRVPVYEGDLDHVTGLVHLRALAEALRNGRGDLPVHGMARPVHVVPETKKIDELLHEFQGGHIQMALVADEYGGTAGIVTIEDLLEEIVGEIRDEYDVEEDLVQVVAPGREAIFDARVSIHDANEVLPLDLDDEGFDTIGGLVYDRLAKVPVPGDIVTLGNCVVRVISTKGRRVQRVRVTMIESGNASKEGAAASP